MLDSSLPSPPVRRRPLAALALGGPVAATLIARRLEMRDGVTLVAASPPTPASATPDGPMQSFVRHVAFENTESSSDKPKEPTEMI